MQQLMSNNIVDLTVENFQQIILEVSKEKIVLIDFWAEGYEPCKELSPILEKIAGDYPDTLLLARVDCEREQQVAAQFGIRNLPTVMVVKDAQPVDGFAGMQPETEIRAMLGKYLPSPEDEFLAKAAELNVRWVNARSRHRTRGDAAARFCGVDGGRNGRGAVHAQAAVWAQGHVRTSQGHFVECNSAQQERRHPESLNFQQRHHWWASAGQHTSAGE